MLVDMFYNGKFIVQLTVLEITEPIRNTEHGFESLDSSTQYYLVED
jgi:hypothetical protein